MVVEKTVVNKMNLAARAQELAHILGNAVATNRTGIIIEIEQAMANACQLLQQVRARKSNVYIIGNGGSAAVASHAITDFMNVCKLSAHTLHESSLMTCMANDFGYEKAFARMVEASMRKDDVLIAISSSGKSANICNAVKKATELQVYTITLSGFAADNPLRSLGELNFWLNSNDYGFVEIGHLFMLHNISDRFGMANK